MFIGRKGNLRRSTADMHGILMVALCCMAGVRVEKTAVKLFTLEDLYTADHGTGAH